jgi:acyl-coenzyme A synthetase/AMP-(fatty) acid ligase
MIEIPEWYNASVLVDRNLEAGRADKVAIFCGDDEVTYGELARRTSRSGHALRALGVDREDRVLLMLNDTPAFPTVFFAVMRIGAVPIPVNTLLQPADYRFFVQNSRARVVVCDQMHHETIRKALEGYDEEPVEVIVTNGQAEGALILEELLEVGEDELDPVATHRDDPAFWLYSSGSTGKPKGAVHLHHDIIYTCETYARHVLEVSQEDVCFSASKLFHAYGLGNNISFPYWAGASTVLFPGKPTPDAILGTAQRFEPTLFFSVPTLYNAMLNREGAGDFDLSSIRLCV